MALGKKARRPMQWLRDFSFEFLREKQLMALRVAVLVLLAVHALILHRCYDACCVGTTSLQQQVYTTFTAHNSSQRIPHRESDKGPFRTWKEARQALHAIRQRDIQHEIGAPLNRLYLRFREEKVRLDHLPAPPTQCRHFYEDDSPIEIDLALVRMLGQSSSKIPTEFVRNVSLAVALTTNYTTRFPLDKSVTIYALKNGKLYFDRRSNHPRSCGHQHKIVGFMSFMREAAALLGPPGLPDVAFRFSCLDNPYAPFEGLWTYSSFKDGRGGPLAFPDDYFTFERWRRLRPNPSEAAYRSKPPRAAWFGGRTGDTPLHHADRQGFLDLDTVEMIENMTSREYFVTQYAPGKDERIVAAFDKIPMSKLLAQYRVLLAIAGHSFASNTLPLLSSNSLVVQQDYPIASWEDHFFLPGIHFLTIPRDMDDDVLQEIIDLVDWPDNDDYFTNMTRLAATVAELVVDPLFSSCYTHRALQFWNSRMEQEALDLDENMVEIIDFFDSTNSLSGTSALANYTSPKNLLTRAFHTRAYSGFFWGLWESALIWWWDNDYNATTYM